VRHVCDGGERRFGSRRETVRSATSMPSLRSSPWILGSTPQGIGRGHPSDQGFDRGVDGRVARRAAPGERGPVAEKAASLPAQHSGGSHDDEGLPPGGPHSGTARPKGADRSVEASAGSPSACRRPVAAARRGSRGRAGGGRRTGTGGVGGGGAGG